MADLAAAILRKSVGSLRSHRSSCARCRRTPVAGELLHVFDSGHTLCSLCAARLPDDERGGASVQRVHASERHLAVVPRAA